MLSYLQIGDTPYKNIKVGLGLSQTQFGVVTGKAFTFTNGIAGLVWGHLSDKYNRKWPLVICSFAWTLCALAISFCHGFWGVLAVRILFAIFMSADVPYSVSLICDYAAPDERGRA